MKFSKDHSISTEKLMIILNGFVHVIRLALRPPAAFLKPEVSSNLVRRNKPHSISVDLQRRSPWSEVIVISRWETDLDLCQSRFSDSIIEEFHSVLFGNKWATSSLEINPSMIFRRDRLYQVAQDRDRPRLLVLESFHWNLDVTLTTAYVQYSLSSTCNKLLLLQISVTLHWTSAILSISNQW